MEGDELEVFPVKYNMNEKVDRILKQKIIQYMKLEYPHIWL
jgi:hypothetical protein